MNKSVLLTGVLMLGLSLVSCSDGASSSLSSSIIEEDKYEIIDIDTPFTRAYSETYNVEEKLAASTSNEVCLGGNDRFGTAELVSITDGDTATFKYKCKGANITNAIRFAGADTHELHHPSIGSEEWGLAEKQYSNKRLTEATQIILEGGHSGIETTYNRMVAFVWVDGELLPMELMEIGLYKGEDATDPVHGQSLIDASVYRSLKNGYLAKGKSKAKNNKDPNWSYIDCQAVPIESQPCVIDKNYVYNFQKIGPSL